ncbi:MAG: hypothetical protein VX836_09900 [Pseudomonadota bacterium]|jgi:uncharacterized protein YciI|nr:hypothetical protein [Pseudomonadota bacterium]
MSSPSPSTTKHFLVDLSLKSALEPSELQEQRDFLQGLTLQGCLLVAGVAPAIQGRGIAILAADSLEDARAVYADAPVVRIGKADIMVNEFRITSGILSRS